MYFIYPSFVTYCINASSLSANQYRVDFMNTDILSAANLVYGKIGTDIVGGNSQKEATWRMAN
jgi:hypothetical protein